MKDAGERLIRYLQDAHAAEKGIADMLEGAIDDTDNQQIRSQLEEHLVLTRSQAFRLEQRLVALGADTSGGKGFFNSVMAKVADMMNAAHDDYDKTTQNLIKAYATEHLERGMYEALSAYAEAVGDHDTAALAREIQKEEEQTGNKLFPLIRDCARNTYQASRLGAA
jgi:ferritin-like metal-binding protein YciE